ncbi:MAG: BMP family ABC transporter substrate-binding protein [Kiritimatiellae bacterium]|nr:BMP family ABC transporter substrate-binding protein [Kiritimatiellia bacterium]
MIYRLAPIWAALLLAPLVVSSVCAVQPDPPPPLRVALLSDGGPFYDQGFNQNCREGLEALLVAGAPIFVQFGETLPDGNFERKLASYAERDFRLIFGIGYRMASAIEAVAADYPRTLFSSVDANYENPPHNVWTLTFQVDECAFPAGYLAAAWADINDPAQPAVAWVGGMDVDSVNQFIAGFRGGVAHYNAQKDKDVQVLGGHVGSFENFKGGQQLAETFLNEGADVVFGVGSLTGNGAIAAAKDYGKWAIGVDTDQFYTLLNEQDIILTSCLKRMDRAVGQVVMAALENQFWGGTRYVGNLANHGVGLAPYHMFEDQIPERLKKEVLDIQRQILEGTLDTGWAESK